MALYAVGDIQGCYDPLARLLDQVNFDHSKDTLICVGDLVNRGDKSLKVLRLLKSLNKQCLTVIGNHDIHLMSMFYGVRTPRPNDTLTKLLNAHDSQELIDWLRHQPLIHRLEKQKTVVCHAGIYPWWTLSQAQDYANEVHAVFRDEKRCIKLLYKIYSNQPSKWSTELGKIQRRRFIINAFTRMRFCSHKGHLNLVESGYSGKTRKNRVPWFTISNSSSQDHRIVFGHWSALGLLNTQNHLCLDTGYVWGREMTMARLDKSQMGRPINDKHIYSIENNR
ncbi:MAG: symmetrical bis(5'-nucleosyl)-tetraphosphatase [Pseudomonadota bacterium]